jgi:hypothetical protein
LQDEAEGDGTVGALDHVVPDALEGRDGDAVPDDPEDDQGGGKDEDELCRYAQACWLSSCHRLGPILKRSAEPT